MLDAVEIKSLEKRWLNWKIKSMLKKIILLSVIIAIIPISWGIYSYLPTFSQSLDTKKVTENEQKTVQPIKDNKIAQTTTKKNEPEKHQEVAYENETLYEEPIYEEEPISKQTSKQEVVAIPNDYVEIEQIDDFDEVPIKKPKPTIKIETSEIEKHKDLRDKFDETKDIVFALMLAEEHYHDRDYKGALRWSIIANNMDSKNERSWIIFAKSMAKNGSPHKAINTLQEYLKLNPSALEIRRLIDKIRSDNY